MLEHVLPDFPYNSRTHAAASTFLKDTHARPS